jgi:hypothetical protein
MHRLTCFVLWLFAASSAVAADVPRLADSRLQIALDPSDGTIRELVERPKGEDQLAGRPEPFALWEIVIGDGPAANPLSADRAGGPRIEPLAGDRPGLRLVWDHVATSAKATAR